MSENGLGPADLVEPLDAEALPTLGGRVRRVRWDYGDITEAPLRTTAIACVKRIEKLYSKIIGGFLPLGTAYRTEPVACFTSMHSDLFAEMIDSMLDPHD